MKEKGARAVRYCAECLTPDSRPRIIFNQQGICNACLNAKSKKDIDWDERKAEFLSMVEPYRSTDGRWDCVVPWSGGKDSTSIAYRLKFELGMNPLLVTFSPMLPNEVGNDNRELMIQLGFDHIFVRPNQKAHRALAKRFFIERGNPKVAWDAGVNAAPLQVAVNYNIPLVFYAEHGESEYGGKVMHKDSNKIRDFAEVIEHQIGDDPANWVDDDVTEADLNPYLYPPMDAVERVGVTAFYFAYFFRWSMFDNYEYVKSKMPFKTHPKGRTSGTFTNFDSLDDKIDPLYYYMQFIKFGFGRTVRDGSRLIQNKHITREQGLEYAHNYDAEFPQDNIGEALDYLQLSREQFDMIVDQHRNQELWIQEEGEWRLRYPLPPLGAKV